MEIYFFEYPVGHLGFKPVIFFVTFPLTQLIVVGLGASVGFTVATAVDGEATMLAEAVTEGVWEGVAEGALEGFPAVGVWVCEEELLPLPFEPFPEF